MEEGGIRAIAVVLYVVLPVLGALFYAIPSLVARAKRHHQFTAILWLNILAGWTFIGWVAALVWALSNPQVVVAAPAMGTHPAQRVAEKVCPRCAETVKEAALVCRYCGHEFSSEAPLARRDAPKLPLLDHTALAKATGPEAYKGFRYHLRPDFQVEVRTQGQVHIWPSLFDFRKAVDALLQKPEA